MQLEMVQATLADEGGRAALGNAHDSINQAIHVARNLAVELVPPVLSEFGLQAALEWLSEWMKAKYGFDVEVNFKQDVPMHDQEICLLSFDAVRELLLNAVKHAQASSARIEAEMRDKGWLMLKVSDQGVGFDPSAPTTKGDLAAGFGLSNIQRRIKSLGGEFHIDSAPGRGATVTVQIPMRQE
jgi:two-component system sensor histidine kinase UhpB